LQNKQIFAYDQQKVVDIDDGTDQNNFDINYSTQQNQKQKKQSVLSKNNNSNSINFNRRLNMTQEYFLGFSGLNKQCFTWDKSQGVICFASNEVAVKETLSTKKQLLFTHSMEPIVKILSNLPKKLL